MKFGKKLRQVISDEWGAANYINYKRLKQFIKRRRGQGMKELRRAGKPTEAPPGVARVALPKDVVVSARRDFFGIIQGEMRKVEAVFSAAEHELYEEWLPLRSEVEEAEADTALAKQFQLLMEKVESLRRYAIANAVAVLKIVKKFDKNFSCEKSLEAGEGPSSGVVESSTPLLPTDGLRHEDSIAEADYLMTVVLPELTCKSFYIGKMLEEMIKVKNSADIQRTARARRRAKALAAKMAEETPLTGLTPKREEEEEGSDDGAKQDEVSPSPNQAFELALRMHEESTTERSEEGNEQQLGPVRKQCRRRQAPVPVLTHPCGQPVSGQVTVPEDDKTFNSDDDEDRWAQAPTTHIHSTLHILSCSICSEKAKTFIGEVSQKAPTANDPHVRKAKELEAAQKTLLEERQKTSELKKENENLRRQLAVCHAAMGITSTSTLHHAFGGVNPLQHGDGAGKEPAPMSNASLSDTESNHSDADSVLSEASAASSASLWQDNRHELAVGGGGYSSSSSRGSSGSRMSGSMKEMVGAMSRLFTRAYHQTGNAAAGAAMGGTDPASVKPPRFFDPRIQQQQKKMLSRLVKQTQVTEGAQMHRTSAPNTPPSASITPPSTPQKSAEVPHMTLGTTADAAGEPKFMSMV